MTAEMVRWIALEIEAWRGELSVEENWLRSLPNSPFRDESFRRINWWRDRIKEVAAKVPESVTQRV